MMEVASYLELVGDVVQHDLVRVGLRRIEEGIPISEESMQVVGDFHAKMVELLRDALHAFEDEDPELARTVLAAKPEVNELLARAAEHRAARMTVDAPSRVAAFSRGTETIEHLRRVYTFAKRIARSVPGVEEPRRRAGEAR
jgi:phosphate:Na+ symporter